MKTLYQVQSKIKGDFEWLDDHTPFDSIEEAQEYIKTQPKLFTYRIVTWEEPETDSEWLEFNEECKSVTPETAIDILTRINEVSDTEMAHIHADNVLCALLRNLGYNDIVNTYERINKWYS